MNRWEMSSSASDRAVGLEAIAEYLASARLGENSTSEIVDRFRPASLDQGYAAQAMLVDRLLARFGGFAAGYKVACTNRTTQELFNTRQPVYGRLLSCRIWNDPATLPSAEFQDLVVEAEFSFSMKSDVPPSTVPWTRYSIAEHVGAMTPSIEIVGHGFGDWSTYDAPTLAADNAVHQGWVRGTSTLAWNEFYLARQQVKLFSEGIVVRHGSGANVLGHPLEPVAWLANALPRQNLQLRADDWVTTGVATEIYPASRGETVRAEFGELGSVEATFGP